MLVFRLVKPMTKAGIELPTGSEVRMPRQKGEWMEKRGHILIRDETTPLIIDTRAEPEDRDEDGG